MKTKINFVIFFHLALFCFLIIYYCLCYYSCPHFSPFALLTQQSPLLRQSPYHGSCLWVMWVCSLTTPFPVLYFTSPWLFSNNQFVLLNPLTSSLILPHPYVCFESGNDSQNTLHIHDSLSVSLV